MLSRIFLKSKQEIVQKISNSAYLQQYWTLPGGLLPRWFQFWTKLHSKGHKPSKVLKTGPALETSEKSKKHKPQNHICDNGAAKDKNVIRGQKMTKTVKK